MFLREIMEVFFDKIVRNGVFRQFHPSHFLL